MEYLFHYTKPENAQKIIGDRTLLFNNIDKTNDPYENKIFNMHIKSPDDFSKDFEHSAAFSTRDDSISHYEDMEYSEEREERFNRNLERKINDISEDYMPIYFRRLNDLKNGIVKTISFSIGTYYLSGIYGKGRTGYLYPRMWAQYGNNSKGVCIVFKKDDLLKNITKELKNDYDIFYGNIKYVDIFDNKHAVEINNLIKTRNKIVFKHYRGDKRGLLVKNIKDNYKLYFFKKDIDWSGENEYRVLILNKNGNNDFKEKIIPINNACIKAIFFGENTDIERDYKKNRDISLLIDTCRNNIAMFKLERDFYKGKYHIMKI